MAGGKAGAGAAEKPGGLSALGLFSESVKSSLDLRFFLIPVLGLVFGIIAAIGAAVVAAPFVILGIFTLPLGILLVVLSAIVFIVVLVLVAAPVISGFYFKSVDQYLKTGKIQVEESMRFALGRWKRLVAVNFVQMLVGIAVAVVTLLPAIALMVSYIAANPLALAAGAAGSPQALLSAILPVIALLGIAVAAFFAISFLISPLLFLWFAAAVLEEKPALECIGRGYAVGRAKYLRNLGALFLMGLLGLLSTGVSFADPTIAISIALGLWVELVSVILIVKAYREGA